jgi:hypothetical protein
MFQFQPHVPDPWTDDLPSLMPTRALPTPPIGIVFLIFLSQRRFTHFTMQRQRQHTSAHHASPVCRCTCWMRGNHHTGALLAAFVQGLIRAIRMWAHDSTFRMGEAVIEMEYASGLNGGLIQDAIVFAAWCDRAHIGEIHENRCGVIWTIHSHDGTRDRQIADVRRSLEDRERAVQFDARLAVTSMAKAGEPVVSLGREHGGPRSSSPPVRVSGVVWCACQTHASGWVWPILGLRQGPRAHSLIVTIDIEGEDMFALLVELSIRWLLLRERPREQVAQEERAQGFHGALIEGGGKATDRRTNGGAVTPKERQERVSSRLDLLVQGFHSPFATNRRTEEDSHNINDMVMSEVSASKANLFFSGGAHPLTLHVMNHHNDFPKPAGRHRGYVSARLDSDWRGRDSGQRSS